MLAQYGDDGLESVELVLLVKFQEVRVIQDIAGRITVKPSSPRVTYNAVYARW